MHKNVCRFCGCCRYIYSSVSVKFSLWSKVNKRSRSCCRFWKDSRSGNTGDFSDSLYSTKRTWQKLMNIYTCNIHKNGKRQHGWLLWFTLLHKENLTETDEYIYLQVARVAVFGKIVVHHCSFFSVNTEYNVFVMTWI
jgi:hypothetical protein